MAIPAQNLTYYNQLNSIGGAANSAFAQGQVPSQGGISGGQSRAIVGLATFVLDGVTLTAVANFIDGVQVPFVTKIVLPVLSVAAPVTFQGTANVAGYTGVGAYGQWKVGQSVTFAGFTNAGNNGTFTILALQTGLIYVVNSGSVAETNPAATATANALTSAGIGGCLVARALQGPSGVADTAAGTVGASMAVTSISTTGVTLTWVGAGSNLQTMSVLVELFPSN